MPGTVWFVGAGPGDPELLTVKGKGLLERALADGFTGFAPVSSGTTAETLEVRPLS